jgi:polyphosphate kinase
MSENALRVPTASTLEPLEAPRPHPSSDDLPEDRYLNRETSWLEFNARVLALAEDSDTPLLERVKFLAIFATNLDEFFMVRVAGLKRRLATGLPVRTADGLTTREQLSLIYDSARDLVSRHARTFQEMVVPALSEHGIRILHWAQLPLAEQERLHTFFREQVFPVLTPLAVDPSHPFPYISGLSLNLAVTVRDPADASERFARVKVPANVPRFVTCGDRQTFVPLEELIAAHIGQLFPGLQVVEHHLFRVTRNADVEVEEDEAEDLLQALERELARRRFGPAVRLEVQEDIGERVLDLLVRELEVHDNDVIALPGLLDLSDLWALADLDRPELAYPPFVPATPPRLRSGEEGIGADVFAALREGDVLVHHPYESFGTSFQRFIEQAAEDPQVLAIKQTLYRTSGDSPVVDALIDAAEAGKQVSVLVEVKARFDEHANIRWARALERAGCHVAYGVIGLKTHCKTALVVRQEAGRLRRYAHVGTGNYNPKTARLYEDFGLLTADDDVGTDLTDLFNTLTGYSRQTDYATLLVAPRGIRTGIVERIEGEARRARDGERCGIRLKLNSLVDEQVIDALYRASRDGVPIQCLLRGICALRPGVPGLSETVRVRSILGRYLEHSRVLGFVGAGEWWIGSADMMHRNLDRRVETLVRVRDVAIRSRLASVLDLAMDPRTRAWELASDGSWSRSAGVLDYQTELASRSVSDG